MIMRLMLCAAVAALTSPTFAAPPTSPVLTDSRLQVLWDDGEFTEGVAVAPDGNIYFSDIAFDPDQPGRIMKFEPETQRVSVHCADSRKSNGLMFDRQGRLIACCGANGGARALCEVTPDGRVVPIVERYKGRQLNSPNDLVIAPDGAIFFSDPRYAGPEPIELDHMSVYRFDPDADSLTRVTDDIQKPNGVMLSPDGRSLYVAETNNGSLDVTQDDRATTPGRMTLNAFPLRSDGTLGRKTVLVDYGTKTGVDGMTVDVEGNIYAAVRSENRHGIAIYTSTGEERGFIITQELPTNCTFGIGPQRKTLYVTAGGALLRIRLDAVGYHPAYAPPETE